MSNFFTEIFQSLKKTSTERISNPFYGVMIITWLAFNWEAVAILFFSDMKMDERVRFINSAYSFMNFYPFITAIFLTFLLPWCTEKITFFQSKPISRTSTLLAIRKKKMLLADISVERFRAKKDVAYERHKAGEEKQIQDMREAIILSKETTGQLNQELDAANKTIIKLRDELNKTINDKDSLINLVSDRNAQLNHLKDNIEVYSKEKDEIQSRLESEVHEKLGLIKTIDTMQSSHKDLASKYVEKINELHDDISLLKDLYHYFRHDIFHQLRKNGFNEEDSEKFTLKINKISEKYYKPHENFIDRLKT